jgi:hypothetical protein
VDDTDNETASDEENNCCSCFFVSIKFSMFWHILFFTFLILVCSFVVVLCKPPLKIDRCVLVPDVTVVMLEG